MPNDEASESDESRDSVSAGTASRLVRAVELIASAHASRARDEAAKDLSRMASGGVLLVLALVLVVPIVVLFDVAAALALFERGALSLPLALATVAMINVLIAISMGLLARSRLSSPVLVETRATLKRAAIVLRGN